MAEARQLKQREYYTSVIAHDQTIQNAPQKEHRHTNTFRSEALSQGPVKTKTLVSRTHEKIFSEKPLADRCTRASYQDSNPLNIQNRAVIDTVQKNALSPAPPQVLRENNTWRSSAFEGAAGQGAANKRDINTFKSTVFGSATPNPINRKKLGGESKGTEVLFGQDRLDYLRSSHNLEIKEAASVKKEVSCPDRKEQVNRELHGQTAEIFGTHYENRKDGALMAQCVDWRNPWVKAIQTDDAIVRDGLDHRERKHQNLQSSVFGGGYMDQQKPQVNKEIQRIQYGCEQDWKTRAALEHPKNGDVEAVAAYNRKQKELLSSNVNFAPAAYDENMPKTKGESRGQPDAHITDAPIAKPKKQDEVFKQGDRNVREPHIENYDPRERASQVLQGNYQKVYGLTPRNRSAAYATPVLQTKVAGRDTKATKQSMLASNHFETGQTTLEHYNTAQNANPRVVDLQVGHLPADADAALLKRVAGTKHIFEATIDQDPMKNTCAGTGRVKIRLSHGEDLDRVKLNFLREGIHVQEYHQDSRKRPVVTGIPREKSREITNHRMHKQEFLQTQEPETFGTTQKYVPMAQHLEVEDLY